MGSHHGSELLSGAVSALPSVLSTVVSHGQKRLPEPCYHTFTLQDAKKGCRGWGKGPLALSFDQGGHSAHNSPLRLTGQKWVTCLAQNSPWQEAETIISSPTPRATNVAIQTIWGLVGCTEFLGLLVANRPWSQTAGG